MSPSIDMNNVLLVAGREIRQILKMKSFWLTLLILPVAFALGPIFAESLDDDEPTRVTVVDRSGGDAAQALEARFAAEDAQWLLRDLSRYVQRYGLEQADPKASWAQYDRWYTDADIAAFERAGGLDAALEKIAAVRPEGVPRDLFLQETIVGLVLVEGLDDVVPVVPGVWIDIVKTSAIGIGITHCIQPMATPAHAVVR